MSKTAIILVTYNGWPLTEACLADLSPLEASDDFVIAIADNGSVDGTVENIRKFHPNIHVYPQTQNLGFGAANNAAIRALASEGVEFDTLCLVNNDTRLPTNALRQLRDELESARAICPFPVLAPKILNKDGTPQHNYFAGLGPLGIGALAFFLNALRNEDAAAKVLEGTPTKAGPFHETCWTSAVCWIFPAQLWNLADGFDERIFMYYEDADLALRFRMQGARFFLTDCVHLTHLGGGSAHNSLSRSLQHDRSQEYVFQKHFGIRGLLLSKAFRATRSLVRLLATLPRLLVKRDPAPKDYLKLHLALLKEAIL